MALDSFQTSTMMVGMRLFKRRRRVDPRTFHQFRSIDEVASVAAGGGWGFFQGTSQTALLALVAEAERGRCQLPGCGKPADDPIHA
jgi:hypothetical protein